MGNGHVKEVASLMEGEWFCYKGGLFNGGGMVMEVGSLMGEEWSCYGGGQFKGGRRVDIDVASLIERE